MTIEAPANVVSLVVAEGRPDVLRLTSTNLTDIYGCLKELRQRPDHPQLGPRETWLDLSNCVDFPEKRGEMLVRAIRLASFLPAGFVGTQPEVAAMAQATQLVRVDSVQDIPMELMPVAAPFFPHERAEFEQEQSISHDLERRWQALEGDHRALVERATVMTNALSLVREQRDLMKVEIAELRSRLDQAQGQHEWSQEQARVIEGERNEAQAARQALENDLLETEQRALALEEGMRLVELALGESRKDLASLRAELEVSRSDQAAQLVSLADWEGRFADLVQRNALLVEDMREKEVQWSQDRANADAIMAQLQSQVDALTQELDETRQALGNAQQEVSQARASLTSLQSEHDELMSQAQLSNRMLDDAMGQVDLLTRQGGQLAAAVERHKQQYQSISMDYETARERLEQVQAEAHSAQVELVSVNEELLAHTAALAGLEQTQSALSNAREELENTRSMSAQLQSLLEQAQARVDTLESERTVAQERHEALAAQRQVLVEQIQQGNDRQARLSQDLNIALSRLEDLTAERAQLQEALAGANARIAVIDADNVQMQEALMEASHEVVRLQQDLDERVRAQEVLSQTTLRSEAEVATARAQIEQLQAQLGEASSREAQLRAQLGENEEQVVQLRVALTRDAALAQAQQDDLNARLSHAQNEANVAQASLSEALERLRAQEVAQHENEQALQDKIAQTLREVETARTEVLSAKAALESAKARIDALETKAQQDGERIRNLETTVVEQGRSLDRARNDHEVAIENATRWEGVAQSREEVVVAQQGQMEQLRAAVAQGVSELARECEAHANTQARVVALTQEATSLSQLVEERDQALAGVFAELSVCRDAISTHERVVMEVQQAQAEAERVARDERRSRVKIEGELMQAQEKLEVFEKQVQLERSVEVHTSLHDKRVRTGERLSARGDLVVTRPVSAGAELVAQGSVHVYDHMQGRVHAGCSGDTTARVYCMNFDAEQVAIAGRFVQFEVVPPHLQGKPVEIWWDEASDRLVVEALDLG